MRFMMTIITVSKNVTALASIIGQFQSMTPSANQNATPTANVTCIHSETPLVSRVWIILQAWGMKAAVVSTAAMPETMVSNEPLPADHGIKKADRCSDRDGGDRVVLYRFL